MNATQKLYYRYKYEQKLPACIRHNLQEVTIHKVINSKDTNFKRAAAYPPQLTFMKRDRIGWFVHYALYNEDIKMIRLAINRFPCEVVKQADTVPRYERSLSTAKTKYTPLRRFKGWKIKLAELTKGITL